MNDEGKYVRLSQRQRWTCGVPQDTRVRVEQAIAFGRSLDWMLNHLDVTTQQIDAVMRRMDECNSEPDNDIEPCGTHAAYNRHKKAGEQPCPRCRYGESAWQKERHLARVAARRALVA